MLRATHSKPSGFYWCTCWFPATDNQYRHWRCLPDRQTYGETMSWIKPKPQSRWGQTQPHSSTNSDWGLNILWLSHYNILCLCFWLFYPTSIIKVNSSAECDCFGMFGCLLAGLQKNYRASFSMKFVRWDWKEEPINSNFGLLKISETIWNYICWAAVPMSASLLIVRYAFIWSNSPWSATFITFLD